LTPAVADRGGQGFASASSEEAARKNSARACGTVLVEKEAMQTSSAAAAGAVQRPGGSLPRPPPGSPEAGLIGRPAGPRAGGAHADAPLMHGGGRVANARCDLRPHVCVMYARRRRPRQVGARRGPEAEACHAVTAQACRPQIRDDATPTPAAMPWRAGGERGQRRGGDSARERGRGQRASGWRRKEDAVSI
jgi:hypothetical protein